MQNRHWTTPRFALYLAAILFVWLGPVAWGARVLLPLDLLWQDPPIAAPEGFDHAHNTLLGDMLYENYLWKDFYRRGITSGEWPLWNPYTFSGHPLYTTGQASVFYPPNLIFAVVPIAYAFGLYTFLHLWAGGLFQYLFLRRIGVGGFGASLGGVIFALCGFFVFRIIWPMLLGSAIWLPLMLLMLIRLSEATGLRQVLSRTASAAAIFALPLLGGFFEIAFYAFMVAGAFTLACVWHIVRSERAARRALQLCISALAAVGLALLLCAPQLLPFFEVKDLNVRSGQMDYEDIVDRALKPHQLLPMVVPDIFGNPAKHKRWDLRERRFVPIEAIHGRPYYAYGMKNYSENGFYLGLLPLLLLPLSIRGEGHHRLFFWLLLALALMLTFGWPIYRVFYAVVPGFEQVRTPFRWMYPATFAVTCLAAIGGQRWYAKLNAPTTPRTWLMRGLLLVLPVAGIAMLAMFHAYPETAHDLAASAIDRWERLSMRNVFGFQNAWDLAGDMTGQLFRLTLMLTLAGLVLSLRARTPMGRTVAAFLVLGVLSFDLVEAGREFNTRSDPEWLDRSSPAIDFLQQDESPYRIARFGPEMTFQPNLPMLYDIHDVGGYDSIVLKDYATYMEAISPQRRLAYNQIDGVRRMRDLDSPLLDLLNVRYLLSTRAFEHPDWPLAYDDDRVRIYRNQREHPRAFLADEVQRADSLEDAIARLQAWDADTRPAIVLDESAPRDLEDARQDGEVFPATPEVKLVAETLNSVTLHVTADVPRLLVLNDTYYPGWRASVDGEAQAVFPVNGIFRGTLVPGGQHVVEFRFEPEPFHVGLRVAGLAALMMALFWLLGLVGRRRRPRPSTRPG